MHNHLKGLYAPKYAPKAKQPLSNEAKWLLINERETRFELATLSLGRVPTQKLPTQLPEDFTVLGFKSQGPSRKIYRVE